MKRLVVCADGTWNQPEQEGAGDRKSTNVLKLLRAVKPTASDGIAQVVFYDKGVGTAGALDRILGGGLGIGLWENILDCYRFIANNHEDGDELYLFGFSRGAFTVRSLAGLIGAIGLADKVHMGKLPKGYAYYRIPPEKRPPAGEALSELGPRRTRIPISCIGVWDTVGALGIPVALFKNLGARRFQFHDTRLGRDVAFAFHAVSIDERRKPFAPALWESGAADGGQHVEQVWFAGVRSNVGGGYPDAGLSDVALDWMIERVSSVTGLEFDPGYRTAHVRPNEAGVLYDSFRSYYRLLGPLVRTLPPGAAVHPSVTRRIAAATDPAYAPANVPGKG